MAEESEEVQEPKKASRKSVWLTLAAIVVVCLTVMGGATYYYFRSSSPSEEVLDLADTELDVVDSPLFVKSIGSFVVNLAPPDDSTFLSAEISLGYPQLDKEVQDEITTEIDDRLAQIRHNVNMVLSSRKKNDIVSVEGKKRLNRELLIQINGLLSSGKVQELYFEKFVFQNQ